MVAASRPSAPPPPGPDNSPAAARARGEALQHELGRLGVAPESLQRELDADTAAKVLAWMRGEGPCPSID